MANSYVSFYEDEIKADEARHVSIQANLTNVCPQHCIMCHKPEWAQIQKGRDAALDPTVTAEALNSLGFLETVVLSGGDPMNYRELKPLLGMLRPDIKFGMFTTGLDNAINRYADLPFERFGYIRFSIDGNSPETWAKIRGSHPNSYRQAWDNALSVSGAMKSLFGNDAGKEHVRIQFTIQSENIREFPAIVETCYANDIPIYGYWVHDYNVVTKEQVKELQDTLLGLTSRRKGLASWTKRWTNVFDIIETGDTVPRAIDPKECVIPQLHAFLDTDGSVFPCCYLVGDNLPFDQRDTKYRYGNIYDNSLAEILSMKNIRKVRDQYINKQNEICAACCSAKSRYYKMNLEAIELRARRATFL